MHLFVFLLRTLWFAVDNSLQLTSFRWVLIKSSKRQEWAGYEGSQLPSPLHTRLATNISSVPPTQPQDELYGGISRFASTNLDTKYYSE